MQGNLLHHGMHRTAFGGTEPAPSPARTIVGTWFLAIAGIRGLVVVAIGLASTHRSTKSLAWSDSVVIGLVAVAAEQ